MTNIRYKLTKLRKYSHYTLVECSECHDIFRDFNNEIIKKGGRIFCSNKCKDKQFGRNYCWSTSNKIKTINSDLILPRLDELDELMLIFNYRYSRL